ncbi:hypothetical protein GA707_07740 [Nostocoides sp. F2B08]|uniref:hypothetical protein n=1 Tax=Nostocoides sp. F2B08 TaxID=2653936 RepID=UPI0012639E9F|nr:hypothetical protein [Tetrasphaera sp. F2B08]KAB7744499.1 hypothetical protein GA707_07740 [Tetrasphaera sp. F2B08]
MLLAHAITLGQARSHLAALADRAVTIEASSGYERVLLRLDALHGEDIPAIHPVPSGDRDELFDLARDAIEDLTGHGLDPLTVELVLDLLSTARDLDEPDEP